jgi:hypothetical protein
MYACMYMCIQNYTKREMKMKLSACQYMLVAINIGNPVLLLSTLVVLVHDEYVFL